jgi:hypothetical protein
MCVYETIQLGSEVLMKRHDSSAIHTTGSACSVPSAYAISYVVPEARRTRACVITQLFYEHRSRRQENLHLSHEDKPSMVQRNLTCVPRTKQSSKYTLWA